MTSIPRDSSLDNTLAVLSNPYRFISERCAQLGSPVFQTRILLQPTICMTGAEAAELSTTLDDSRASTRHLSRYRLRFSAKAVCRG